MLKRSVGVKATVTEGCTEYRGILQGIVCLLWIIFLIQFVTYNSAKNKQTKKTTIKVFREKVNLSSVVPSLISGRTGM